MAKKGFHPSKETIKKLSESHKGKHYPKLSKAMMGNHSWLGRHHSEESKKKMSGENNHRWNGGKYYMQGYIYLLKRDHPYANSRGYIPEHRLVAEKFLGRLLTKKEKVHHINKIITDNRVENLYLFNSDKEHIKYHQSKEILVLKSNLIS